MIGEQRRRSGMRGSRRGMSGRLPLRLTGAMLAPALALVPLFQADPGLAAGPAAGACSREVYEEVRRAPDDPSLDVSIRCALELGPDDLITRDITFEGAEAGGASLDCHGGTIGIPGRVPKGQPPTIRITSRPMPDGRWSVPRDITIRNCKIYGSIAITGPGADGQADGRPPGALDPDPRAVADTAAPSGILLDRLTLVAAGPVPVRIAAGVTQVTLSNSVISGVARGPAIALDAGSARNTITGNRFEMTSHRRELVAVDGSAGNLISGNRFLNADKGGIFLFRACGTPGAGRRPVAEHNRILGNRFTYQGLDRPRPAIWLNARMTGRDPACVGDPSTPAAEGRKPPDAGDNLSATSNTVADTRIIGGDGSLVRDDGAGNSVTGTTARR